MRDMVGVGVVQKFLRHKIDRSYGYICSEYELFFINKKLD